MPKDWDKNREALQEYHTIREAYYKKRAPEFLARAKILRSAELRKNESE